MEPVVGQRYVSAYHDFTVVSLASSSDITSSADITVESHNYGRAKQSTVPIWRWNLMVSVCGLKAATN